MLTISLRDSARGKDYCSSHWVEYRLIAHYIDSISILLSCLLSVFIFDFSITTTFVAGSSLVIYATYLYSLPDAPVAAFHPVKLDALERGSIDIDDPEVESRL